MEKIKDIHIGVPYRLGLVADPQLDKDLTMVCIYVPSQNKRYKATLSEDEDGSLIAEWNAEQTDAMVPTSPILEVYRVNGDEIVDILDRREGFAGIKRSSVSTGVLEGE